MAFSDSDDRSILGLVSCIANQKCKLNLRAQKKNMETISQIVKEDRKTGN